MSFFLTHCMPRLEKITVIVSGETSRVQTPLRQPSRPTRLCGWGLHTQICKSGKTIFWYSPIWWIFSDAGYYNDCLAGIPKNLDGGEGFVFRCAGHPRNWAGRPTLTLIPETQRLGGGLLYNFHIGTLPAATAASSTVLSIATTVVHGCGLSEVRICLDNFNCNNTQKYVIFAV